MSCRNELAEPHSFAKAQRPEFVADHAVPFDRVAAIEQSEQVRHGKAILGLVAFAVRTG